MLNVNFKKIVIATAMASSMVMGSAWATNNVPITIIATATIRDANSLLPGNNTTLDYGTITVLDSTNTATITVNPTNTSGATSSAPTVDQVSGGGRATVAFNTTQGRSVTLSSVAANLGAMNSLTGRTHSLSGSPVAPIIATLTDATVNEAGTTGSSASLTAAAVDANDPVSTDATCIGQSNGLCVIYIGGTLTIPTGVDTGTYTKTLNFTAVNA